MRSLVTLRALEPGLRLGWSVPRVKKDYTRSPRHRASPPTGCCSTRAGACPRSRPRTCAPGRIDALMAHWRMVTPRLVRALRDAGGDLYVWTVDDAARIRRLEALGVTGVITNDPRLFDACRRSRRSRR